MSNLIKRIEVTVKAYLLALEIRKVEVGRVYTGLPLHCTLVHWFWVDDIDALHDDIRNIVKKISAPTLHIDSEDEFTGITKTGTIPVKVNKVQKSSEISLLHEVITNLLEENNVRYSMPEYIHDGYVPHVTHQNEHKVSEGEEVSVKSLYLADADAPEYGNERRIINRFNFKT